MPIQREASDINVHKKSPKEDVQDFRRMKEVWFRPKRDRKPLHQVKSSDGPVPVRRTGQFFISAPTEPAEAFVRHMMDQLSCTTDGRSL